MKLRHLKTFEQYVSQLNEEAEGNKVVVREYMTDLAFFALFSENAKFDGKTLAMAGTVTGEGVSAIPGLSIKLQTTVGTFMKPGHILTGNPEAMIGSEHSLQVGSKGSWVTLGLSQEEAAKLTDAGISINVADYPKSHKVGDKEYPLTKIIVLHNISEGASKDQILAHAKAQGQKNRAGYMMGATNANAASRNTFKVEDGKASFNVKGGNATVFLVYSPEPGPKAEPKPFKFDDSFEYNDTKIKTDSDAFDTEANKFIDELKAFPETQFRMKVRGNASKVDTTYDGGNEKLAYDRAAAIVVALKNKMEDAGISLKLKNGKDRILVDPKADVTAVVDGPEYTKGSDKNASTEEYKTHQYVKVELSPVE